MGEADFILATTASLLHHMGASLPLLLPYCTTWAHPCHYCFPTAPHGRILATTASLLHHMGASLPLLLPYCTTWACNKGGENSTNETNLSATDSSCHQS
ncbi:hypothetical protein BgiBS90_013193 [Biomphalaria glabrata]|nr:hypothetical protein BgiBS90_013193 [Biomphalaria glabrata]